MFGGGAMTLKVLESEAVKEAGLPLAELAARLGMPTGWETIPDAVIRLEHRLSAAMTAVEARLGSALLRRRMVLGGAVEGGIRMALPVRPVASLLSVEIDRGQGFAVEIGARLVDGAVVLSRPLRVGWQARVVVQAGYGPWPDIPADLREAVILDCEAGEIGAQRFDSVMDRLLAPYRMRRLGGGR
jgi:hypothetical protein